MVLVGRRGVEKGHSDWLPAGQRKVWAGCLREASAVALGTATPVS